MEPAFPGLVCAVFCLILFTTIAGVDGLYFHLYRYRLYARPASLYEHKLHTVNAVLFVPQIVLLVCLRAQGLWLWLLLGLFATTVAVEVTKRLAHDLGEINRRLHILEGFEKVFDALDEIIKIIRKSEGKQDAANKIMARFGLDDEQTDARGIL